MRKETIVAITTICFITAIAIAGCVEKPQQGEMIISNYPKLFEKDVIIIVGENVTQIELDAAKAIAYNLGELTGSVPVIKTDAEVTESEKAGYNLTLVGRPKENKMLQDVYERTNATRVTDEYPGAGKGILEVLRNPWNESKMMLLVEGSDEWGVRAGDVMLEDRQQLKNKAKIFVDWGEAVGVKFPIDSPEEAIRYADTDIRVKEFIKRESTRVGTSARFLNKTNDPFPKFLNKTDNWWIVRYESLSGVERMMTIYVNPNGTIIYGGVVT